VSPRGLHCGFRHWAWRAGHKRCTRPGGGGRCGTDGGGGPAAGQDVTPVTSLGGSFWPQRVIPGVTPTSDPGSQSCGKP
jgi:hypothetical protein